MSAMGQVRVDAVRLSDLDYRAGGLSDIEGSEFGVLKDLCATGKIGLVNTFCANCTAILLCKTRWRNSGQRFRKRASASRLSTRGYVMNCQGLPCPPAFVGTERGNISSGSMPGVCRDSDRILP